MFHYRWSYGLDDIDLAKEDISQIVYEVVNHKAANACDKDKRAPKPRTRKRHGQDNQGHNKTWFYLNWIMLRDEL